MNLEREFDAGVLAAVPRRLPRRPDAEPVRRLQHVREVRGAPRPGPPPVRVRRGRDRPLRPPRRRRRRRARASRGPRDEDKDQTYFLSASARTSSRTPVPARRADQARGPRGRPRRSASRPPTSPRARRSASCPAATTATRSATRAGWAPEAGPIVDADGERVGEHGGAAGYTVGQRQGLGVALGEPRYVSPDRPADEHDPARAPRGPRDPRRSTSSGVVRRRRAAPRGSRLPFRAAGPDPSSRDARRRDGPAGHVRETARGAAGSSRPTRRCGPPLPARRAVLYDGDACLGGGRIARRHARPTRPSRTRPPSPAAHDDRPALVLSVLVGIFHTALYVFIRGSAGGRLPLLDRRRDPRRVGRRRGRRPARHRPLRIGDFHLLRASIVAWLGIGLVAIVATLGPQAREGLTEDP